VAIDPKHLPDDPTTLQQMVLDLMAQLDREFSERSKVESLLRELLDAKRNRKSEQLSQDQMALFASLWQAGKRNGKQPTRKSKKIPMMTSPANPEPAQVRSRSEAGARPCQDISSARGSCTISKTRRSTAPAVHGICV
jgi:hypothetical protein